MQRAGFAWEFLRRNRRYRGDFEIMSRHVATGTASEMEAALALGQRWGLSFPVRSPTTQRPRADPLGRQCAPGCHCAHGITARSPEPP
ncbi:DUF6499 domain-containing protein, partial [Acinetobacter baumannii]